MAPLSRLLPGSCPSGGCRSSHCCGARSDPPWARPLRRASPAGELVGGEGRGLENVGEERKGGRVRGHGRKAGGGKGGGGIEHTHLEPEAAAVDIVLLHPSADLEKSFVTIIFGSLHSRNNSF